MAVAPAGFVASSQCRSQIVASSSRYGSPPLPNTIWPICVGARVLDASTGAATPVAWSQWRIDATMFLPTPSATVASSRLKTRGSSLRAFKPLAIHPNLRGKDSCRPKETVARSSLIKRVPCACWPCLPRTHTTRPSLVERNQSPCEPWRRPGQRHSSSANNLLGEYCTPIHITLHGKSLGID